MNSTELSTERDAQFNQRICGAVLESVHQQVGNEQRAIVRGEWNVARAGG